MRSTRDFECQTVDCKNRAIWWLQKIKDEKKTTKHVCSDCRDHLLQEDYEELPWH